MSDIIARIVNDTPVTVKILADAGIVVRDEAYGATWNGDTTHSPSRNAVYDEFENRYTKAEIDAALALIYTKAEINAALDVENKVVKANVGCVAYLSADQDDNTSGTNVKVAFDSVVYDIGGDYNTTNNKFTAPVTGYYDIGGQLTIHDVVDTKRYKARIYKNGTGGTLLGEFTGVCSGTLEMTIPIPRRRYYLSATDYIEIHIYINDGGTNGTDINSGATNSFVEFWLVATA